MAIALQNNKVWVYDCQNKRNFSFLRRDGDTFATSVL